MPQYRLSAIPARRRSVHSPLARTDLEKSIGALVATLAEAHTLASRGVRSPELEKLLARAKRELDVADEKLLMLDRHFHRSVFRQAERIRDRIDLLQGVVARNPATPERARATG